MRQGDLKTWLWYIITPAVVIFLCWLILQPAHAQLRLCWSRDSLVAHLGNQKNGEVQTSVLRTDRGVMFELWRNPDTKTWTIFTTGADGLSCIVAIGRGWVDREILLGKPT